MSQQKEVRSMEFERWKGCKSYSVEKKEIRAISNERSSQNEVVRMGYSA